MHIKTEVIKSYRDWANICHDGSRIVTTWWSTNHQMGGSEQKKGLQLGALSPQHPLAAPPQTTTLPDGGHCICLLKHIPIPNLGHQWQPSVAAASQSASWKCAPQFPGIGGTGPGEGPGGPGEGAAGQSPTFFTPVGMLELPIRPQRPA